MTQTPNFLVDTNVISELVKPSPNPHVERWIKKQPSLNISAISIYELELGIESTSGRKRQLLRSWYELFRQEVAKVEGVDELAALTAARLVANQKRLGRTIGFADALIGATALVKGHILVTRNTRDFENLGIALFNPFAAQ